MGYGIYTMGGSVRVQHAKVEGRGGSMKDKGSRGGAGRGQPWRCGQGPAVAAWAGANCGGVGRGQLWWHGQGGMGRGQPWWCGQGPATTVKGPWVEAAP